MKLKKRNVFIGITSFLIVLFTMPLGHALMILMEHLMEPVTMHYATFFMGLIGLIMVITGVFAKGDTQQTLWGLFGGLLFWTGWIEFIYVYYAHRFGVQPLIVDGEVVTKPEYLIMPSSFGFWIMFMLLYLFNIKSGCDFFNYLQRVFFRNSKPTSGDHRFSAPRRDRNRNLCDRTFQDPGNEWCVAVLPGI